MPMFVGSQSFIFLPSFMFVSALVSEIRELKENKERRRRIQFNTFRGHLIYPFFNQRYLLSACTDSICLKSPTPQTESDHQDCLKYTIMLAKPGPSLYTQYYRTVSFAHILKTFLYLLYTINILAAKILG